jgi:hypothetical protein
MSNDKVNVLHELAMARSWLGKIKTSKAKNPPRYKHCAEQAEEYLAIAHEKLWANHQRPSIFSSIMRFVMSYFGWLDRIPYLKREGK